MAKRVYQLWKGSNKFFLCGRLIFGPDVRSLVVTVFLILVPVVIFCIFVVRHLLHRFSGYDSGYAILVVTILYTLYVLVVLMLTSARDPGIVPRAPHPPEPEDVFDSANSPTEWTGGGQTPRLRLPRTKNVVVNGTTIKVKYCDTCMLYRPPRCSHCSICNNCVERFDHHCPWVGQCIGQRNYRYFFMFVSSSTLLCIYVFAMSALYIKFLMDDHRNIWHALRHSPASIALMLYTFIAVWFVGGLTLFHLYLISTNQTTYENFRYRCDNKANPYDEGIIKNFSTIFCMKIKPSRNHFRAKVEEEACLRMGVIPRTTESRDVVGDLPAKMSIDLEAGRKAAIGDELDPEREAYEDLHNRKSNGHDAPVEIKDGYEDAFTRAIGQPLSLEGTDTRSKSHPRRSSWGRKSGSWEITPDLPAASSGDKTLPVNKEVTGKTGSEEKCSL
uniref:S-acyltransferase n=1 Tax=Wollemia nobilis TaxID=56998 RepID=A0A0C9S993_9CONI